MCGRFLATTAGAIVLAGLAAAPAAAAERPLTIGDRVRLTAPSVSPKRIEGTLAVVDAGTITVFSGAEGRSIGVPRSEITRLEVTRGRKSRWTTGALIGAGWGVALGVVLSNPPSSGQEFQVDGTAVGGGAMLGASLGALVGAVLRTDRWTTVPADTVTLGIGPAPRGVALAVRVAF